MAIKEITVLSGLPDCHDCLYLRCESYDDPCRECITQTVNGDGKKPNFVWDTTKKRRGQQTLWRA